MINDRLYIKFVHIYFYVRKDVFLLFSVMIVCNIISQLVKVQGLPLLAILLLLALFIMR